MPPGFNRLVGVIRPQDTLDTQWDLGCGAQPVDGLPRHARRRRYQHAVHGGSARLQLYAVLRRRGLMVTPIVAVADVTIPVGNVLVIHGEEDGGTTRVLGAPREVRRNLLCPQSYGIRPPHRRAIPGVHL